MNLIGVTKMESLRHQGIRRTNLGEHDYEIALEHSGAIPKISLYHIWRRAAGADFAKEHHCIGDGTHAGVSNPKFAGMDGLDVKVTLINTRLIITKEVR
jgi:hypothetical protein